MESLLFSTSTAYFAMHGFLKVGFNIPKTPYLFSLASKKKVSSIMTFALTRGEYEINRLQNAGNNENEIIYDS